MSRIFRIPSCNPSSLSPPPTASTSISETVNGSHQFKISGYTLSKGMGVGRYISSDTFMIGGYFWAIYFYPDGKSIEDNATYVSLFIALASEGTDVRALFELTLLDQSGKEKHKVHSHFGRRLESGPYTLKYRGSMWYAWAICFYPAGKRIEDNATYVSLFIAPASEGTDVRALFELTLLDQSGKEKHRGHSYFGRRLESGSYTLKYRGSMWYQISLFFTFFIQMYKRKLKSGNVDLV